MSPLSFSSQIENLRFNLFLILIVVIVSSLVFCSLTQHVHATQSNPDLFVSAENSQFQNYFAGAQVIEVKVTNPSITSTNQIVAEPSVTVNDKKLRMAQGADGNWYAFFADSKSAQIADSTQPIGSGKGLDFGMFCSSVSAITATGVDFSNTTGIAIASSAPGATDGSSSPTATISSTCSGLVDGSIKSISGSTILNHVVRKAPSLNLMSGVSGGKVGQIGINQNAFPIIQLFDFSAIPTPVTVQYNKGGQAETVNLTFDRIPQNLISLGQFDNGYFPTAPIKMTLTDPQLIIDPTDKNSWTFATNPLSPGTYYMAFDNNGKPDADGTAGMKDIISLLSGMNGVPNLLFNHNGKMTIFKYTDNALMPAFVTNGIQTLNSQGSTLSLQASTQPVTLVQNTGNAVFVNFDSLGKPDIVSNEINNGQAFSVRYNDVSSNVVTNPSFDRYYGICFSSYQTVENSNLTMSLLCNKYNYATTSIVTNPSHGKVVISQNNTATYTPNPFFSGDDPFSFKITSGITSSQAYNVPMYVFPVDYKCLDSTKPNSTISTTENYPAQIVLGCKASSPITYSVAKTTSNGTLVIDPNTGQGTYTPNQFFAGSDKFSYKFNPGGVGFSPLLNVTINVKGVDYTPTAKVGADQSIHEKQIVTLNGSASIDPYYNDVVRLWNTSQGNIPPVSNYLKYSWTQTAGIPVTLSSKTVSSPTFTSPSSPNGIILTFTLTVSDKGTSTSHPVSITVFPATVQINQTSTAPVPSPTSSNIISVSTDKPSYHQGDSITISGKLSSTIPNHPVTLEVLNTFQNPAYIASLTPASDGSITTKLPAKGQLWESSGTYTIKLQYNSTVTSQTTFYFAGNGTSQANTITNTPILIQNNTIQVNNTSGKSIQDIINERIAAGNKIKEEMSQSVQQTTHAITNATQQDIQNISQAIAAEVNIRSNKTEAKSIDSNILVQTTQITSDSLGVQISANNQTSPKIIAFNLAVASVNVQNLKDLGVMYDGKSIQPASDVSSLLHAKSTDDPKYVIVVTQYGVQILVLVPHFSTHTITLTNMSKVIPVVPEFPFASIMLLIATFSIILLSKVKRAF
jgi:hypothetical protein